jgi:hypothetical protein
MLRTKIENVYMSKLVIKFINTLFYINVKLKMEKLFYYSFFFFGRDS